MAYPNPFGNKEKTTSQDAMDEDDDLKINPLTSRQKTFEKFKQLQNEPFKTKSKPKRPLKGKQLRNKNKAKARKRAKSLPRKQSDDNKDDYIFFHEKTTLKSIEMQSTSNQFDALNLETSTLDKKINNSTQLKFDELSKKSAQSASVEIYTTSYRCIRVPGHRMIHVRRLWKNICEPIIKQLKLQIRMNSRKNLIEIRMVNGGTNYAGIKPKNVIQKGSDFVRATVLGFEIKDSLALIRMDDIFLESFDIRDIKFFRKKSDHWMRAIGRIAGQYGKIKYSIENSTNTRIVIFGFKIHLLGSYSSIRLARNSISRLVMGSSPGNVYAKLRVVSNRLKHKF